jgi:CRP-like cAMP-binding protein
MTPKAAAPGGVGGGGGAGRGPDRPTAADLGGPAAQSRSGPRVIAQTIEVEIASEDLAAAKGRLANLVRALGLVAERARSADAEARSDRLAFRVPHELVREFTAKLDLVGTIMKQTTTRQDLTAEREQLDAEQRELHVQQQAAETQSGGGQRQSKKQAGGLAANQRRMSDIERRLAAIEERIGYVLVEITLVPAK